ncbi:hypothetical protein J1605_019298, partial [Eschrichtius robustus]
SGTLRGSRSKELGIPGLPRTSLSGISERVVPPPHPQIGDPRLVICMDCSADTMTNRLLQRSGSGPRADDRTALTKRLETYYRASIPMVAYYETKTQLHKLSKVKAYVVLLLSKALRVRRNVWPDQISEMDDSPGAAFSMTLTLEKRI